MELYSEPQIKKFVRFPSGYNQVKYIIIGEITYFNTDYILFSTKDFSEILSIF